MKYYSYKIKVWNCSKHKWVLRRDYYLSEDELFIGHEYANGRFLFIPVSLFSVYEDDDL